MTVSINKFLSISERLKKIISKPSTHSLVDSARDTQKALPGAAPLPTRPVCSRVDIVKVRMEGTKLSLRL